MPVTFHIPGGLRQFTAGQSNVAIEHLPATLGDALSILWTLYPGVRDRIATEQGQVREHINIFVGDENVRYTGGLATPLSAGSEISIVPAVSGGWEKYPMNKLLRAVTVLVGYSSPWYSWILLPSHWI